MNEPAAPTGWHKWLWVAVSSGIYLGLITAFSAISAGLEAAEPGADKVWMWGIAILWLPALWIASEMLGNPVLQALEELPWWMDANSAVRITLGVAGTLPFFAFMVWTLWLFRRWFGAPGW